MSRQINPEQFGLAPAKLLLPVGSERDRRMATADGVLPAAHELSPLLRKIAPEIHRCHGLSTPSAPSRNPPGLQRGILDVNTPRQDDEVEHREYQSICGLVEDKGQHGHFANDDQVVGMADIAIGTTTHEGLFCHGDDTSRPEAAKGDDKPWPARRRSS